MFFYFPLKLIKTFPYRDYVVLSQAFSQWRMRPVIASCDIRLNGEPAGGSFHPSFCQESIGNNSVLGVAVYKGKNLLRIN